MMKQPTRKTTRKTLRTTAQRSRSGYDEDYYEDEPRMKLSRAFVVMLLLHIVAIGGIIVFNNMKVKQDKVKESEAANAVPDIAPVALAEEGNPDMTLAVAPVVPTVGAPLTAHYLRQGETLPQIAAAYGTTVQELIEINNLGEASSLEVGQRLIIPPKDGAVLASTPVVPSVPATNNAQKVVPPVKQASTVKNTPAPVKKTQTQQQPVAASTSDPVAPEIRELFSQRIRGSQGSTTTANTNSQTPPASAETSGNPRTYTVVKGDNPHAIARQFGVDYQELLRINNISDPRTLQIGQVLTLPNP